MMRKLAASLLASCLFACTVGPHHPDAHIPLPPARSSETISPQTGETQHISVGATPLAQWWQAFGSAKLDALVDAAFANNNDLATAEANLRQAQEDARSTTSEQGPQVDLNYQAERAKVSQALSAPLADPSAYRYTLHTAQVTVAYPLDVFGEGRSKVESARAAAQVASERLRAARTTVISNLVLAVIQHAALESEIAAQRAAIADNSGVLRMLERRKQLGDVGDADVAAQQTALATAEAALPSLVRQSKHEASLITLLTGAPPGSEGPALPTLEELRLPADLPLALPADIVANRPDVRAAEAQMKGAAADVGTAIAARLPSIQLTGNAGGSATTLMDMFAGGNPFFALIGGVSLPLFHSGQLLHQQHVAEAALESSKAQYRAAALQAFLDVDDALAGLRTDADALDAAARADTAAARLLDMTQRQAQLGAVGQLAVLTAASAASQAALQHIQARAARLSDTVALFQACGTPTSRD